MRSARAMNVSRGLFRTWVLVTVLWLCLAVLMANTGRLPGSNSTGAFQIVMAIRPTAQGHSCW